MGEQLLSLAYGCHSFGTVVHEIMHAIGFHHQHMRADRDNYLNIHWQNIKRGHEMNFNKLDYGLIFAPFDYYSIMQYGSTTFSIDGKSPTITPKIDGVKLVKPRHKGGLSKFDIISINDMYNCEVEAKV
ncbi:uncharacterized protein B4U80_01685 [Leptotrombidium deliense]|uniref:Metalloendopeptidase n=1 Tax=Leptotrombidium deliense TaxID=299467 RepID=A0A443RW78_9ACAR|nr:uncharacterized protein B4U80_01685 [Leptotrombidium deliense]